MFDISFAELALVFIIALVVLGPERLPKAARSIGHWMGRARAAFNHLKNELDREVVNQEMQEMFREKADSLRKEVEQMNRSLNENLLEQKQAEGRETAQPAAPAATLEKEPETQPEPGPEPKPTTAAAVTPSANEPGNIGATPAAEAARPPAANRAPEQDKA